MKKQVTFTKEKRLKPSVMADNSEASDSDMHGKSDTDISGAAADDDDDELGTKTAQHTGRKSD